MELVSVTPGKYIVAVSGGVDSMVLLDLLAYQPGLELIVAHFDHGIREDSQQDREVVQAAAEHYHFPFIYAEGGLATDVSEAEARKARYAFLNRTKNELHASAIIMAHHQDDVIETMCINLIRGTGRKGLTSLRSGSEIIRPLLDTSKQDILKYAQSHAILWREDSTNQNDTYLRNYLRHNILPAMQLEQRQQWVALYKTMLNVNKQIDQSVVDVVREMSTEEGVDRSQFVQLPHAIAGESLLTILRTLGARNISRKRLEQLIVAAKTALPGRVFDVDYRFSMEITRKKLIFGKRSARK